MAPTCHLGGEHGYFGSLFEFENVLTATWRSGLIYRAMGNSNTSYSGNNALTFFAQVFRLISSQYCLSFLVWWAG